MKRLLILLPAAILFLSGCHRTPVDTPENLQRYYVNYFAYNTMNTYYLWVDEIAGGMKTWGRHDDPIEKVRTIRYKNARGEDIDRWTQVTDDFKGFSGAVSGNTRTYGFDYGLYYTDETKKAICAIVHFVYADSPAAEAHLQRGDVILKINGKTMTEENYYHLAVNELSGGNHVQLGMEDNRTVDLSARDMYEDPVNLSTIIDAGGKKIGYLHYTSFTLSSCDGLHEVMRRFKQEGVEELVLDLRYNSGGYVSTEVLLASMLAPEADVMGKSVFSTEVYNKTISKEIEDPETRFSPTHAITVDGKVQILDISDALLAPKKIYALITEGSASASESLIGGLAPYVDMTIIGQPSSGKYCSGLIISSKDWYDAAKSGMNRETYDKGVEYSDNWGIYVMYSRYADRDGKTLCMPDGITPDILLEDNPFDGYLLGDPKETMLAKALSLAGYTPAPDPMATRSVPSTRIPVSGQPERPGLRVFNTLPIR